MKMKVEITFNNKTAVGSVDLITDWVCIILLGSEPNPYLGVSMIRMSSTIAEEKKREEKEKPQNIYIYIYIV